MTLRNIVRSFALANLGALLGSEPNNRHKRFKNYSYCDSKLYDSKLYSASDNRFELTNQSFVSLPSLWLYLCKF